MPSNVRVAVRIRPLLENEIKAGHKENLLQKDIENNHISIY